MRFSINDIINKLPYSYPFLLIDRVIKCDPAKSITAVKNVTFNEPFFIGHFRHYPIMPGVLIIESLAQASVMCILSKENQNSIKDKVVYFMSIEKAKFRKPVIPGDVIVLQSNVKNTRLNTCKFECIAYVDKEKVAEAKILATLRNI